DQRDRVASGRAAPYRVEMATLEVPVALDALVRHPAVESGDQRHLAGPVLGSDRPLQRTEVHVGHADEPLAGERRLPAGTIAKAQAAPDGRAADVQLVPVVEHLDVA